MATLTVSLAGSAIVNGSKSYTVSDADLQRIIDWIKAQTAFAGGGQLTDAQALLAWVKSFVDHTGEGVKARERGVAAAAIQNVTFS